jgi:acetyltransferase-like isoleucine patch superfamily enzyme
MGANVERVVRRVRTMAEEPMWRVALIGKLAAPYRRRQFHTFGNSSVIYRPSWLYGTGRIAVGEGVLVLPGAWLAVERQAWEAEERVVHTGDRVAKRTNVTISAACSIVIEDDVVFGGSVTVVDSDHTWADGHPNVLYNRLDTGTIHIGRGTWVGDHSTVLRDTRIGAFCLIGANSVVRGDIPDHSIAVGAPAKVVGSTLGPGTPP